LANSLGFGNRILWVDACRDMPAVYSSLDVLCSASCSEGFPNVIAEAMACGVPCVVTDVGDSARIVGDTGMVVPSKDSVRLATAIEDSLRREENETELQRRRTRIVEKFGLEKLVASTELLFRQALEKRRR